MFEQPMIQQNTIRELVMNYEEDTHEYSARLCVKINNEDYELCVDVPLYECWIPSNIAELTHLTDLNIMGSSTNNKYTMVDLSVLNSLTELQSLSIGHATIRYGDTPELENLRKISVEYCYTHDMYEIIQSLNMFSEYLEDIRIMYIQGSKHTKEVRKLDVSNLQNLQSIELYQTKLNCIPSDSILNLHNLKKLLFNEYIYVRNNAFPLIPLTVPSLSDYSVNVENVRIKEISTDSNTKVYHVKIEGRAWH